MTRTKSQAAALKPECRWYPHSLWALLLLPLICLLAFGWLVNGWHAEAKAVERAMAEDRDDNAGKEDAHAKLQEPQAAFSVKMYAAGDIVARLDSAGKVANDPAPLVKVITEVIRPESWKPGCGGRIEVGLPDSSPSLLISQTARGHQDVSQLLDMLRQIAKDTASRRPSVCYGSPKDQATAQILSAKIACDFTDQPLSEVIGQLKRQYKLVVRFDPKALRDGTIAADSRVTFHAKHMSLRSALRSILQKFDLDYTLENGTLFITKEEAVEERLMLVIYSVGDLIGGDTLRKIITSAVAPMTWRSEGGPGSAWCYMLGNANILIVWQTEDVHEQIADIVAVLHKIACNTAANSPALCYGLDFPDDDTRSRMCKILSRKVTLDFDKQPLDKVLLHLKKSYGLDAQFDNQTLFNGHVVNLLVTIHIKDISLRSALRLMLRELDLTYFINDEILFVSGATVCEEKHSLGFYPVGDLVMLRDKSGHFKYDYRPLINALTSIVQPESWDCFGGCGLIGSADSASVHVLYVSQTYQPHVEIGALLRALRTIGQPASQGTGTEVVFAFAYESEKEAKKALDRALATKVLLRLKGVPVASAIEHLRREAGINIALDRRGLKDAGIAINAPVPSDVSGESLRSALDMILPPLRLGWIFQDEVLLITTAEAAESHRTAAIYPVADMVVRRSAKGDLWDDYDTLIGAITSSIAPTTWEAEGGPGSTVGLGFGKAKVLVIAQTDAVHCRIAELLSKTRAARKHPVNPEPPLEKKLPRR